MTNVEPARVLVADDDEAIRLSVAEILRSRGYSVSEAQDGQEALDKVGREGVEVILLDVKMPLLDGISVVDRINPRPPPPGVLLVTAYDIDEETHARLGTRVCKILRKPVPPVTLLQAVQQAVRVAAEARRGTPDER